MLYYIYAYENMYQGLHGIYSTGLIYAEDINEVESVALEMSKDVINDYTYGDLEIEADESGYDIDTLIDENTGYDIYKIRDDIDLTYEQLCEEDTIHSPEAFIERYCEEY